MLEEERKAAEWKPTRAPRGLHGVPLMATRTPLHQHANKHIISAAVAKVPPSHPSEALRSSFLSLQRNANSFECCQRLKSDSFVLHISRSQKEANGSPTVPPAAVEDVCIGATQRGARKKCHLEEVA